MQIDFHYAVTYVAARFAGFSPKDAKIICYSSQYVDAAINSGVVHFRNKAMYSRISSAHTMLDYRNFQELANHQVWIPFHFLPGNGGSKPGTDPSRKFIDKLVCKPDSYVAKDMVESCIASCDRPYGLHRLGITMHVLADTFAHQGFAGINHEINDVANSEDLDKKPTDLRGKLVRYFGSLYSNAANKVISNALPLGHGPALTFPDMPFLKWSYEDGAGKMIPRDNTKIFMDAVVCIHEAMVRYQKQDPNYTLSAGDSIPMDELKKIKKNFLAFKDDDGDNRNDKWLSYINRGKFTFTEPSEPKVKVEKFIAKGPGSWKHKALDTTKEWEAGHERFQFTPEFLVSDWKLFHDALQIHRIDVIRNILPKYGICAA
ncbi:MAG: hypothetical protein HN590_12535 [Calditrichaeota bacterium]|nr:hypothetical protein [Calditrichota bacterium]